MIFLSRPFLRFISKNTLSHVSFVRNNVCIEKKFGGVHNPWKYALSYLSSSTQNSDDVAKTEKKDFLVKVVESSGPLEPYLRLIRLDNPTGEILFLTFSLIFGEMT